VERRGAKEFVVLTTARSSFFVAESEAAADAWAQRIAEALQRHDAEKRERERKPSNAILNHHTSNANNTNNHTNVNGTNNISNNISCARS